MQLTMGKQRALTHDIRSQNIRNYKRRQPALSVTNKRQTKRHIRTAYQTGFQMNKSIRGKPDFKRLKV